VILAALALVTLWVKDRVEAAAAAEAETAGGGGDDGE